jgi:uncharacterized protein
MRQALTTALLLAVLVQVPAGAGAQQAQEAEETRSITVSGSSEVNVAPDLAFVTGGVETRAQTAAKALEDNRTAMTEVLAALEAAGIARADVQTSQFDLGPVQAPYDGESGQSPEIVAYIASNLVTVRVRDVAGLGTVIDALAEAGANRFQGISFDVSDKETRLDAARGEAVADARRKAELYAAAAGVALGPVLSIREAGQDGGPVMFRAEAMAVSDTPVAPGEVALLARVDVVWSIE